MSISWASHPTFSVHFHTFCQFPFGSFVSQVFLREAGEALASRLFFGRGYDLGIFLGIDAGCLNVPSKMKEGKRKDLGERTDHCDHHTLAAVNPAHK